MRVIILSFIVLSLIFVSVNPAFAQISNIQERQSDFIYDSQTNIANLVWNATSTTNECFVTADIVYFKPSKTDAYNFISETYQLTPIFDNSSIGLSQKINCENNASLDLDDLLQSLNDNEPNSNNNIRGFFAHFYFSSVTDDTKDTQHDGVLSSQTLRYFPLQNLSSDIDPVNKCNSTNKDVTIWITQNYTQKHYKNHCQDKQPLSFDGLNDNDLDGVNNSLDYCPDTPHGSVVFGNGCVTPFLTLNYETYLYPNSANSGKFYVNSNLNITCNTTSNSIPSGQTGKLNLYVPNSDGSVKNDLNVGGSYPANVKISSGFGGTSIISECVLVDNSSNVETIQDKESLSRTFFDKAILLSNIPDGGSFTIGEKIDLFCGQVDRTALDVWLFDNRDFTIHAQGTLSKTFSSPPLESPYLYGECYEAHDTDTLLDSMTWINQDYNPPTAPDNLSGISGIDGVTLTWIASKSNNQIAITDYIIEYKLSTDNTWIKFNDGISTNLSSTVTGLEYSTPYDFQVKAVALDLGVSPFSSLSITTREEPRAATAPTSLATTPGIYKVNLTWTAPDDNGGLPITDYLVFYKLSTDNTWIKFNDGISTNLSSTVTGLDPSTEYNFKVQAVTEFNGKNIISDPVTATTADIPAPGAPTDLAVIPGINDVSLTWTAPDSDGGLAITDYIIQYKMKTDNVWINFVHTPTTTTAAKITGLIPSTEYNFRVQAVTEFTGEIPFSDVVTKSTAAATAPGVPTMLHGTLGINDIVLTWTAPADNGGFPITDYKVQYKITANSGYTDFNDGVSTDPTATVNGLEPKTHYHFRVQAVTEFNGEIPFSGIIASKTLPAIAPGAPTDLATTPRLNHVSLTWTAPADNGGFPITDYIIQYKMKTDNVWINFVHTATTTPAAKITGLIPNTSYDFRVQAVTEFTGEIPFSDVVTAATAATAPGAPTSLATTRGINDVSLTWTAPADNGDLPITDYLVFYKLITDNVWINFVHKPTTATSATVTGLDPSTRYNFRVQAVTEFTGVIPFSDIATATTLPAIAPGAPTSLAVIPGINDASLTWTAPADNGGFPITDYIIQYKLKTDINWITFTDEVTTATSATVTGLDPSTEYNFRVQAVTNYTGQDIPYSDTVTAKTTPITAPGAPTDLAVIPGINDASLTWTAPDSDGGLAITDYIIEYKLSTDIVWINFDHTATTTPAAKITGLAESTSYDFKVQAVTEFTGLIPFSDVVTKSTTATPITAPGAPTSLAVIPGINDVSLTWTAPADNGNSDITDYIIEYQLSNADDWKIFVHTATTTPAAKITGLAESTSYDFRVQAVTEFTGLIPFSDVVTESTTATPITAPTPITQARSSGGGGSSGGSHVVNTDKQCSDCTPPTIGLDPNKKRIIENGLVIGDNTINVGKLYQKITNTAQFDTNESIKISLRIYEDLGVENMKSVSLTLDNGIIISLNDKSSIKITDQKKILNNVKIETQKINHNRIDVNFIFEITEPLTVNTIKIVMEDKDKNLAVNHFTGNVLIVNVLIVNESDNPINSSSAAKVVILPDKTPTTTAATTGTATTGTTTTITNEIECREGFNKMLRPNNALACITDKSLDKLILRNWVLVD